MQQQEEKKKGREIEFPQSLIELYALDLISFASESLGRSNLSSEVKLLNSKTSTISDFQQACIQVGTLWRNGCASGGEEFQNKLRDQGILFFCLQILKSYFDNLERWEELDSRKTVLVLFQVLANATTGNKPIQIHLYEISDCVFFKEIIPKALLLGRNFTSLACMSIYNSIAKGNLQIEFEFFSNREIMIQLLERLYQSKHTEEWVFLIYKKYFLSKAYLNEENEESFFFNSEETCRLMLEEIEKSNDTLLLNLLEIIDQFSNEEVQAKEPTPAAGTYKSLIEFCVQIINILREKFLPGETGSLGILTFKQFECLFVSLECLSNLSSLLILSSAKSPENELRTECISAMLTLLGLSCAVKELKNEGSGICLDIFEQAGLLVFEDEEQEDEEKKGMYLGYKTLLIRTIANLTFKSRQIQDFVREQEGLPLVLSCCGVQEQNPYLREWGVFCVRNLCEDNEENQKFIQDMNLEGIDSQSEEILAKQGFKANVKNGKINLEKVDENESKDDTSKKSEPSDSKQ